MISRRRFLQTVSVLLAAPVGVEAQQAATVPRVGFLSALSSSSMSARLEAFRKGLRELGYVGEKTIVIEERYADGVLERLPALAAELLRLKVEVIVTTGPTTTRPAKEATSTIPLVMGFDSDPVGSGFVASLAHPGGNITGLSALSPEISGKQLQLLKEIVPRLFHAAILGNSTTPGNTQLLKETRLAARALGIRLQYIEVRDAKDIDTAFREAGKQHADAVLVLPNSATTAHRNEVAELARKGRRPAIYYTPEFVEAGGLMSHGVSLTDLFRRAAYFVDRILKGDKPGDLPIAQPTKFELVVNLKTAKALGLTIPPSVVLRADHVIE